MPERSPFGASATCSTSGGPGSEVKMTSHCSASAFGLSAQTAPAARWRSAAARRTSCTTSSYPAFCRLAAMLAPIVPSPIKPTFMLLSRLKHPFPALRVRVISVIPSPALGLRPQAPFPALRERDFRLSLREHVLGDLRGGHCRRPAGVEGEMRYDLADLLLGDAVVERAVQMTGQLPLPAERDQRRDDDQAAVALLQARAFPDFAEQPFLAVIDQVGNNVAHRFA